MNRWWRYWFADGGRDAAAFVRIALALSVLLVLASLDPVERLIAARPLYRPVGIWMLAGHHAPPVWLLSLLSVIAWCSTFAMLVGAFTRIATAVSCVTSLALASLVFASTPTWSHGFNIVFIAQIAFLGARGGDAWSIDAFVRKRRGLPPLDVPGGYQWSLRLVQLAVALMFASAFVHKVFHTGGTLRWAFSDNLRNQLLVRFDLAGIPRSPLVAWIVEEPWRYRGAAVMNLVSQLAPLAAVIFIKRPLVRAVAALFFMAEVIALGMVTALWNIYWLPLAAVFIDWDFVLGRPRPHREIPPPRRAIKIFIVTFVVYDALLSVAPRIDQWLNTYPFSGFPMFASIRAREPYGEHLPYSLPADRVEVTSDVPLEPYIQAYFDHHYRGLYRITNRDELRRRLTSLLERGRERFPTIGVHRLRLYLAFFVAPPYPEPARFVPHLAAVIAEVGDDGSFHTHLGESPPAGAKLYSYRNDDPTPIAVERFEGKGYFVAVIDGTPWLLARR